MEPGEPVEREGSAATADPADQTALEVPEGSVDTEGLAGPGTLSGPGLPGALPDSEAP